MKNLIVCSLLFFLNGCFYVRGSGVLKEYDEKYSRGNSSISYYVKTNDDKKVSLDNDIGMCGAGIFGIFPIPLWINTNTCEKEGFKMRVSISPYSNNQRFFLKYNNTIHEPKDYISGGYERPVFIIGNFEEFKNAKDKAIIVKENNILIKEIPFDWGIMME